MSRGYRSIGEVLALLEHEHPDLTISKIRFLESQGLIAPQRTPSGYRKFFEGDVERLNWVLIQQRDHFLPLKEIKRRLAAGAPAKAVPRRAVGGVDEPPAEPSLFAGRNGGPSADDDTDAAAELEAAVLEGSVSLTAAQLARAVGVEVSYVDELWDLGIITPVLGRAGDQDDNGPVFDHDALLIARTAAGLADHGVAARNLRMFKVAADREAGVYEQLLGALIARGNTDRLRVELAAIADLAESLRRLLLQRAMRPHLD